MPFHREFFGAVGGGLSSLGGFLGDVAGGVAGFAGEVFGGARERLGLAGEVFGPPAPTTLGERLGGFLAERAVPFIFPTRAPKICGIIGPCLEGPGGIFTGGTPLPRGARRTEIPVIPKSPGTLGQIPIIPQLIDLRAPLGGAFAPFGQQGPGLRAGGDITPLIGGITPALPPKEEVMAAALALPGGAAILRQLPGLLGGAASALGVAQFFGGGEVDLPFGGQFFNRTMAGVRARSLVRLQNPVTGSDVWFRNVGQPILFAGDFATVKRVRRIAATAHRRIGHRRGR